MNKTTAKSLVLIIGVLIVCGALIVLAGYAGHIDLIKSCFGSREYVGRFHSDGSFVGRTFPVDGMLSDRDWYWTEG